MSNITVQKESSSSPASLARREGWDPFHAMRELMQWDPFRDVGRGPRLEPPATFMPAFEVKETKDAFQFKADVPGVEAKDIDVKLANNRLTISGKREAEKTDKGETYYSYERSYGSFSRSFTIPQGANEDSVRADLKDGVLQIVVPKKPEMKAREIPIKTG